MGTRERKTGNYPHYSDIPYAKINTSPKNQKA